MPTIVRRALVVLAMLPVFAGQADAAELVALSPQTWDRYIPQGKEVDGIYGDFALANDQIMSVVAHPGRGRHANMTVRGVGGCLIDLTRRDRQSDQLSAFYPGAQLRDLKFAGIDVASPEVYEADDLDRVFVRARRVTLRLVAAPREHELDVEVSYTLEDGWPYLLVTTGFANRGQTPIEVDLLDSIRADRSFEMSHEDPDDLFWAYPHLKRLGAERLMATCVGIELTGSPLPLNHQNAFPLVLRPNTQDNGGPTPDDDPAIQIERLALWDAGSDKLVQVNHPDIGWLFRDRDGNGVPDRGFAAMFGKMDVIEVHPPDAIFGATTIQYDGKTYNNTIVNWLQLLNQGRRVPGVVNTDAHYNFHGSGWLRNYVKSPTDDPAEVKTLNVVHSAERGNLVMSNGPFLEVKLRAAGGSGKEAIPGDDHAAPAGTLSLKVRVQCPNWFSVDRVQVFLNGRPKELLNFTRLSAPERFSDGVVKFDQEIPLRLDRDAHVIVAAIGEKSKLGRVMGPEHAGDRPVAVSNPIFVDVDGGGFKHNGDTLGALPLKSSN